MYFPLERTRQRNNNNDDNSIAILHVSIERNGMFSIYYFISKLTLNNKLNIKEALYQGSTLALALLPGESKTFMLLGK